MEQLLSMFKILLLAVVWVLMSYYVFVPALWALLKDAL